MSLFDVFTSWFVSKETVQQRMDELVRQTPTPTVWLFGKAGSGKSSIVRFLTGQDVQVGEGFRPTTRHSSRYDFPNAEMPLVHFLDTRGLGEVQYDPQEDIDCFHGQADAMIVTAALTDFAQEAILEPLRKIRSDRPDRPVILALTRLHEVYPGQDHPPYPFNQPADVAGIPELLARPLAEHGSRFNGLFDVVVPIDLTQTEDGFSEPNYGGEHLR